MGGGHWYVILGLLLIVLIFYGPGRLPEIGGAVGKAIREFRNPTDSERPGRKADGHSGASAAGEAAEVTQGSDASKSP